MNPTDPVVLALCRHHAEVDPQRLILRLCHELLAECPRTSGPTPLKILASLRGVRRCRDTPLSPVAGCSGLLVPHDGGYQIAVNSSEPPERRRFSVAHEIVHTFFREVCPDASPSAEEERLCDLGAAELTMPTARFIAYLAAAGLSFSGLDACRHEYAVSLEASARRAIDLTDQQACVLIAAVISETNSPLIGVGETSLRIVKWWKSRTWPDSANYTDQRVVHESLMAQAFAHQDQRRGRARLGIPSSLGVFELEARGYGYPLPHNPQHRQVVTLARIR